MNKKKGLLQRVSFISGVISFIIALVTGVAMYFQMQTADANETVTASLGASIFFFVCVGFVLGVMGKADLPGFGFNETGQQEDVL